LIPFALVTVRCAVTSSGPTHRLDDSNHHSVQGYDDRGIPSSNRLSRVTLSGTGTDHGEEGTGQLSTAGLVE
jgi:hypothetical protein